MPAHPQYKSPRTLLLSPLSLPPASDPPALSRRHQVAFETPFLFSSNPSSSTPISAPKTGAESAARGGSSETDGWGPRSGEGEEMHRKPGWRCSASPFSLGPGRGQGRAGTGAARGRVRGVLPAGGLGPARGRAQGGRRASLRSFFPRALLGRSRGARSRSERRAARGWGSRAEGGGLVLVGGGGCVWGGGRVRNGGAARQRVHFPGNQQQAAIFRECCPFN